MKKSTVYSAALMAAIATSMAASANASNYQVTVTNLTNGIHFTPLILATHSPDAQMFSAGHAASTQLQAIAEGGDTSSMAALLESIGATVANGDGLIAPGGSATFMIEDGAGSVLSLAGMLLPTNDGFVGLNSVHLPNGGAGDSVTYDALGYDAGTEANDELVGSGAPGEAGFPAPPPIVASGTGVGGTGVPSHAEGFVHVHRNVIGDMDVNGGVSDINSAVHRWLNPVARVVITKMADASGVTPISGLTGTAYSTSALELFWQAASSADSYITGYEVRRNGTLVSTLDGTSYFDQNLQAGVEYTYEINAMDANGNVSSSATIAVRTNSQ